MPYIPKERRKELTEEVRAAVKYGNALDVIGELANTSGELNYILTEIVLGYLQLSTDAEDPIGNLPLGYARLSAARAVLHDMHDEFYDKLMRPYEDMKCRENGEVFFTGLPDNAGEETLGDQLERERDD